MWYGIQASSSPLLSSARYCAAAANFGRIALNNPNSSIAESLNLGDADAIFEAWRIERRDVASLGSRKFKDGKLTRLAVDFKVLFSPPLRHPQFLQRSAALARPRRPPHGATLELMTPRQSITTNLMGDLIIPAGRQTNQPGAGLNLILDV